MITLRTGRQGLEAARLYFFPFMRQWKLTHLANLANRSPQSGEYLLAVAANCLIDEVILIAEKKIINTTGKAAKLKLTDAQGIVFFRMLIILPLPPSEVYLNNLRNHWIEQIDLQLHAAQIYQHAVHKPQPLPSAHDYEFDET